MKIRLSTESTNPSNIGSYKNTPNVNSRSTMPLNHEKEPGSYKMWHCKELVKEGFLSDLLDSAIQSAGSSGGNSANSSFESQIHPHTAKELYDDVCLVLLKRVNNKKVNAAAELWLTKSDNVARNKQVDELFRDFKVKAEDAVIEYCTDDAIDIVNRLRTQYGKKAKITGDINYGTILSKVTEEDYDLTDKLEKLYDEYTKELEKLKKPSDKTRSPKVRTSRKSTSKAAKDSPRTAKPVKKPDNRSGHLKQLNNAVNDIKRSIPDADQESIIAAISDLVTSEFGISALKQILRGGR